MRKIALPLVLLLVLASSVWSAPRNIILFIGDGMGLAHVSAARIVSQGIGGRLAMDTMPVAGFVTTHSANSLITDSAASATAYATGVKTNNGMVGMAPDGQRTRSILEAARALGKATGLVTTVAITDATPACFAAHVEQRSRQTDIAGQLLAARVDVLLGGGRAFFLPKSQDGSRRSDYRDLLSEAAARGYHVVENAEELAAANGHRILGLFSAGNLTTEHPEPQLSALTAKAIDCLSREPHGFFLMVEGGLIDAYAHQNDLDGMVRQLVEFDRAVACGLDFARHDDSTLVIVTADHETGGLTLVKDEAGKLSPAWSTKGHTAVAVPLYAFGPGSERFAGLMDNTEVAKTMAQLWDVSIGTQGSAGIPTSSSRAVTAAPL